MHQMLLGPPGRRPEYLFLERARELAQGDLDGKRLDAEGVLLLLTLEVWLRRAGL
jgi:hypothetical protein